MSRFVDRTIPFYLDSGAVNALGTVYFGEPGQDAKTNPKTPYFDEALTIPATATQSLTSSGQLAANLWLDGEYSLIADDSLSAQVESFLLWYQDKLNFISQDIPITDGVLDYTVTNTQITLSAASVFLGKDGSETDGSILFEGSDYTVSGSTISLKRSYSGGRLRISSSSSISSLASSSDFANVKLYGATGNGTTNDTAAFVAAFAAGDHVYAPPGSYVLNAVSLPDASKSFFGAGVGVTKLLQQDSTLFTANISSSESHVSMRDFSVDIDTSVTNAVPITYIGTSQASGGSVQDRLDPRLEIESVEISTDDNLLHGIHLTDCMHAVLNKIHIQQDDGILTGNGITIDGANKPVEFSLGTIWCLNVDRAINSSDAEGLSIFDCNFVAINTGVYVNNTTSKPQCSISNTHINALVSNIDLSKVDNPVISGCVLFRRPAAAVNQDGIKLTDCADGAISGNTFTQGSWYQVALRGTTTGISIEGNSFNSAAIGIIAEATTSDNVAKSNSYLTVTDKFSDAGSNKFSDSDDYLARFDNGGGTDVPLTGSFADIPITTQGISLLDVTVGASSITANRDMTLSVTGQFELSGSTGVFAAEVEIGGTHTIPYPAMSNSDAAAGDIFNFSGIMSLSSGDVLTVAARSGTTQNIVYSVNSWVQLQEI
jgi:hypothetical protein